MVQMVYYTYENMLTLLSLMINQSNVQLHVFVIHCSIHVLSLPDEKIKCIDLKQIRFMNPYG